MRPNLITMLAGMVRVTASLSFVKASQYLVDIAVGAIREPSNLKS